jgi:hypothetical protein
MNHIRAVFAGPPGSFSSHHQCWVHNAIDEAQTPSKHTVLSGKLECVGSVAGAIQDPNAGSQDTNFSMGLLWYMSWPLGYNNFTADALAR